MNYKPHDGLMAHPYGAMRQSLNYSQFIFTSLCGDNTAFSLGFLLNIHRVNRPRYFTMFIFLNGHFALKKPLFLNIWSYVPDVFSLLPLHFFICIYYLYYYTYIFHIFLVLLLICSTLPHVCTQIYQFVSI